MLPFLRLLPMPPERVAASENQSAMKNSPSQADKGTELCPTKSFGCSKSASTKKAPPPKPPPRYRRPPHNPRRVRGMNRAFAAVSPSSGASTRISTLHIFCACAFHYLLSRLADEQGEIDRTNGMFQSRCIRLVGCIV